MDRPLELTLEQKFALRSFETQVDLMSRDQARHMCKYLYEQMLVREVAYKELLGKAWGFK